jgi:hypothetical protein
VAKDGTKIYCPNCKEFNICKAVSPTTLGKPKAQRWYRTDYQDISWFRRARRCLTCKQSFLSAELDETLLEELIKLREKLAKRHKLVADRIRSDRPWLVRTETVPLDYAEEFVRRSAWWHTHSSGNPVRAPKHAERIYKSHHGWAIDFGANTFLVGKAIARCNNEINAYIDAAVRGDIPDLDELKSKLRMHICGAVANNDGYEYEGYYPLEGQDMMFGAQSIDVNDGVKYVLQKSGVSELLGST